MRDIVTAVYIKAFFCGFDLGKSATVSKRYPHGFLQTKSFKDYTICFKAPNMTVTLSSGELNHPGKHLRGLCRI